MRQWGVRVRPAEELAGGVELHDLGDRRVNLSYVIFPPYRRCVASPREHRDWRSTTRHRSSARPLLSSRSLTVTRPRHPRRSPASDDSNARTGSAPVPPVAPTPRSRPRPRRTRYLNDRQPEPTRPFPYALIPHPACLLDSSRRTTPNLGIERVHTRTHHKTTHENDRRARYGVVATSTEARSLQRDGHRLRMDVTRTSGHRHVVHPRFLRPRANVDRVRARTLKWSVVGAGPRITTQPRQSCREGAVRDDDRCVADSRSRRVKHSDSESVDAHGRARCRTTTGQARCTCQRNQYGGQP